MRAGGESVCVCMCMCVCAHGKGKKDDIEKKKVSTRTFAYKRTGKAGDPCARIRDASAWYAWQSEHRTQARCTVRHSLIRREWRIGVYV